MLVGGRQPVKVTVAETLRRRRTATDDAREGSARAATMIRGGVESNVNLAVARSRTVARPGCSTVGSSMGRGGRVHRGRIRLVRHGRSIEISA